MVLGKRVRGPGGRKQYQMVSVSLLLAPVTQIIQPSLGGCDYWVSYVDFVGSEERMSGGSAQLQQNGTLSASLYRTRRSQRVVMGRTGAANAVPCSHTRLYYDSTA